MFVQFIEATVTDAEGLQRQYELWHDELADRAGGWLGSTGGITPDGTGFIAARFASPEAAAANADRPEQDRWWSETAACLADDVTFTDCPETHTFLGGGSDEAAFVQVIRGRVNDPEQARAMLTEFERRAPEARPDVLGGYVAFHDDDHYTQVVYFTSEEDARAGEVAELDGEDAELDRRFRDMHAEPPRFLDLPDPWLASA